MISLLNVIMLGLAMWLMCIGTGIAVYLILAIL